MGEVENDMSDTEMETGMCWLRNSVSRGSVRATKFEWIWKMGSGSYVVLKLTGA